jgi:hypothetical protein
MITISSIPPISSLKQISNFSLNILYNISRMASDKTPPKHPETTAMWKYGSGECPGKLKIATWNVNGIRSIINKGELQLYLNASNVDIICINETKIDLQGFVKEREKIIQQFNNSARGIHK